MQVVDNLVSWGIVRPHDSLYFPRCFLLVFFSGDEGIRIPWKKITSLIVLAGSELSTSFLRSGEGNSPI